MQQNQGKLYTGWSIYHATNRPMWQFRKGKYASQDVYFFRSILDLSPKRLPRTEDIIYKHKIVFVCNSMNLPETTWTKMEKKRKAKTTGRDIVVVDLLPTVLLSKRKLAAYRLCTSCEKKITTTTSEIIAYCDTCLHIKKSNAKKAKVKQKAKEVQNAKRIQLLLEEINHLKLQAKDSENKVAKLSIEKYQIAKQKDVTIDELRRENVKMVAEIRKTEREIMYEMERNNLQVESMESLVENMEILKVDISNIVHTSSERVNHNILKIAESQSTFMTKINYLDSKINEEKENIHKLFESMETIAIRAKKALLGISPATTSPFGMSLARDVWYFGIHQCSSAKFQEWGTAIERQGNIGYYNENMVPSIESLLDTPDIPVVTSSDLAASGIEISLAKLSHIFDDLNFDYAALDIVVNSTSSNGKSLRKHRDLFFPLLEIYQIDVGDKRFANITRQNILSVSVDVYQQLFLEVYHYHLKKGKDQTFRMKDTASHICKLHMCMPYVKGAYVSYATYDFYSLDIVKLCFTRRHHGRGHEMHPIHVQLHTYVQTYKYEWQEPCLRLEDDTDLRDTNLRE
jgi:hypothetical protein